MKKSFKRLVSLLMVCAMMCSFSAVAFAAEVPSIENDMPIVSDVPAVADNSYMYLTDYDIGTHTSSSGWFKPEVDVYLWLTLSTRALCSIQVHKVSAYGSTVSLGTPYLGAIGANSSAQQYKLTNEKLSAGQWYYYNVNFGNSEPHGFIFMGKTTN